MDKIKEYYKTGKEWVVEKWFGSVMDRFLIAAIAIVLLFLFFIVIS